MHRLLLLSLLALGAGEYLARADGTGEQGTTLTPDRGRPDEDVPRKVKPRAAFGWGGFSYTDTEHAFTRDGKLMAVGGQSTLLLRDAKTGKKLFDLSEGEFSATALAFSADDRFLAVGIGEELRLLDVATRNWAVTLLGHTRNVCSVAFSADGKVLASGDEGGTIRLWNRDTGKLRATLRGESRWVRALVYSPDGKFLVSAGGEDGVVVWDPATGKRLRTLRGHSNGVERLDLAGGGKVLASSSSRETKIWQMPEGKELRTFKESVGALTPDGKYWISVNGEGVKAWDVATGASCGKLMSRPCLSPLVASISPDGRTLGVRCDSERWYLWDLAELWPPKK